MFWWFVKKVLGKVAMRHALRQSAAFEADTHRPREAQDALLARLLGTHGQTQFGRDHHFHEIHNLADFRRNLPISCYEDYEPYLDQVRKGKLDALIGEPLIHMFAMTSGTTASRKYIPVTPQYLADYRRGWTVWGIRAFEKHPEAKFGAILQVAGDWDEFRTEGGIPCGSVSGLTATMQRRIVRWMYCMPAATTSIKDTTAKYYTGLRLSLPRIVRMIVSANPSTLVNMARLCDDQKEKLIRDIHDGTLSKEFNIPADVREALQKKISAPNRARAKALEAIVRETGALYPKDCWPELQLLGNWTGGSVGAYLRHYPRYYGDAAVRDLGLVASEGRMSIPIEDHTPSGVLDISTHFYEFVPQNEIGRPQPTVLRADELQEGECYFILLTTSYGFCRYNIYDLVRVTGFHNRTPIVEFLNKGSHFANLTGEKISEYQVAQAVQASLRELDSVLSGYSLAPCWEDEAPYYGLFVERGDLENTRRVIELAVTVDRHLRRSNIEYDSKRSSRRLGAIRAELLPSGAWTEWNRQRLLRTGGTAEQYKQPCLISDHTFRDQMPVEEEIDPVALFRPRSQPRVWERRARQRAAETETVAT